MGNDKKREEISDKVYAILHEILGDVKGVNITPVLVGQVTDEILSLYDKLHGQHSALDQRTIDIIIEYDCYGKAGASPIRRRSDETTREKLTITVPDHYRVHDISKILGIHSKDIYQVGEIKETPTLLQELKRLLSLILLKRDKTKEEPRMVNYPFSVGDTDLLIPDGRYFIFKTLTPTQAQRLKDY